MSSEHQAIFGLFESYTLGSILRPAIPLALVLGVYAWLLYDARRKARWPRAKGVIISSRFVPFSPEDGPTRINCMYSYKFVVRRDEVFYVRDKVFHGRWSESVPEGDEYPFVDGQTVEVSYNPRNPNNSLLDFDRTSFRANPHSLAWLIVVGVLITALLVTATLALAQAIFVFSHLHNWFLLF